MPQPICRKISSTPRYCVLCGLWGLFLRFVSLPFFLLGWSFLHGAACVSDSVCKPASSACSSTSEAEAVSSDASSGSSSDQATESSVSLDKDPLYPLRFSCFDNAAYHSARAGYYDKIHRGIMATVILASSGTIAAFGGVKPFRDGLLWWSLVPLLASTADLVFAPGSKAQVHAALRARYFELLADIDEGEATKENCRRWMAALHRTSAQEPPITYRAIKAMAYNAAVDSLWPENEAVRRRLDIPWYDRILGRFMPLHAASYKPKQEN